MSTAVFTICANNYLAHASTLASSFKKHHPSVQFFIAILDEPNSDINYDNLGADEVIWIPSILLELVTNLKDVYTIAELCTVVKPEMFMHLFNRYESLLYLDPDIKVYSPFVEVFEGLKTFDMVLTPHICSPTGEIGHPLDKDLMRTGIYNLGFLAINKTPEIVSFVKWWDKRVKAFGYHNLAKGYFYDQIWLGYAPAFLDNVLVLRNLGYNVANWNLHERELINNQGEYSLNNAENPLRFFHFSNFKMEALPAIASYNENFNLENRNDIIQVYMEYKSDLLNNGYDFLKEIEFKYGKRKEDKKKEGTTSSFRQSRFYKSFVFFKKSVRTLIKR